MPTLFCCILNCESESVNSKKRKIFYRLPQNSDRKQLWLNQIGDRIKYGTVSSNSRICNSHFATGKPNLDSGHIDYMPTIFPWSTKEEKLKSFKSVEEYESKIKELEQKILAKAFLNASSGSKLSQESSTVKFELSPPDNGICSKLIIDTTELAQQQRAPKTTPSKNNVNNPVSDPITNNNNGTTADQKPIAISNSLEKSLNPISAKVPIFKDSFSSPHNNANNAHQQQQHPHQHQLQPPAPALSQQQQHSVFQPPNLNTQSTIQLVPDSAVSIKNNLLNYLLSSISRVNMANNNSDFAKSLSVNVAMPTAAATAAAVAGPLNLSQSYNKSDDHAAKEKVNEIEINRKEQIKKELVNQPDPNIETGANFPQRKNSFNIAPTPDRTTTPGEETSSRSCTCTKSSCLKLYCECFANGNLCCSGCTCINCRNNDNHKEERAKIVSSYLERDPWVFNSKIENKDVGKKHSKGCNCLKSSCLKNYCECFENKVFCSSLCRCRMCYNNEEHTQHNNRDDTKIYASSHTSESLSVLSENSPRDVNRKRKKSSVKTNEIYEDVSSNESDDEIHSKRCQLDSETVSIDNDKRSTRNINSMEIPPVLPQEDDFTEEELALMVKFREQRTEKPANPVKVECISPPAQLPPSTAAAPVAASNPVAASAAVPPPSPMATATTTSTSPPVINIPAHLDSNLLLTLSKSLAVANLGLNSLNVVNTSLHEVAKRPSGIDLLSLLATQQLMVSRQSSEAAAAAANLNCINMPPNCNHVIPINLTQMPSSCISQMAPLSAPPVIAQSRVITTSPTSVSSSICQSKPKLSTEDYVRKHIEAAERAVRADYMRKDNSSYKKPITKQKVKIEPFPLTPKSCSTPTALNSIKPALGNSSSAVGNNVIPHVVNGRAAETTPATTSPVGGDGNQSIGNLALYNWISVPSAAAQGGNNSGGGGTNSGNSSSSSNSSVLHPVQMNYQSSANCQPSGGGNDQPSKTPVAVDHHHHHHPMSAAATAKDKHTVRNRNKSLRQSLQLLRSEIRSLKFHMRADQSRLRRLEKNMHILRSQIGK